MTPFVTSVAHYSSMLVIVAQLAIVAFLIALTNKNFRQSDFLATIAKHSLWLGFIVSLGSVLGSYFFSVYAGFPPCMFCWYARIFLLPQVIIFAVALYKRDATATVYSLALSVFGVLITLWHYYGQMFNTDALPCSAEAVSCAKREFVEFGYITIPMMAFTTFALLIVIMLSRKFSQHE